MSIIINCNECGRELVRVVKGSVWRDPLTKEPRFDAYCHKCKNEKPYDNNKYDNDVNMDFLKNMFNMNN